MSNYDVVTIGAATLDIFMRSDKFKVVKSADIPGGVAMCEVYGGKMEVEEVQIMSGGGATNTAVSFAKKDLKTAVIAEMGNDPQSLLIHKDLEEAQVDTRFLVQEADETTAVSVVLIADDGGRSIMVYRGAAGMLSETDLPLENVESRWIHISSLGGSIPLLKQVLTIARSKNMRISLNPGLKEISQKEALIPLLSMVEILFLNRDEAAELFSLDVSNESVWRSTEPCPGARVTVVTDGPRGGKASIEGKVTFFEARKTGKVIDTTGAGDAFASGMVSGVLYGKTYEQSLEWGISNATAILSKVGAKRGLLTLSEINR
jgi:ribokinase